MAFVADMSVTATWFLPSQATAYTQRMMDRAPIGIQAGCPVSL